MKKILTLIACAFVATAGMAQSTKAQMKMDEGKHADAITILKAELDKNAQDAKAAADKAAAKGKPADLSKFNSKAAGMYNQLGTCHAQLFNPELMKAANQQPLDTAKFVRELDEMVNSYNKSYEYDHMPDAKGKVKAKFDADNVRFLEGVLDYYFYSAIFSNQNGDKAAATENFKKHLALPNVPALAAKKDSILAAKKDNYEQCAYFCTILNYEQKNWAEILASVDAGLSNPEYNRDLYLIKAEAVLETTKDTMQYVNVLKDAICVVEDKTSFGESLLAIFYERDDAEGLIAVADELIAKNPDSKTPYYIKGCAFLNIKKDYPAARAALQKVLDIDDTDLLGNANMSYAWTNDVATRRLNGEFKLYDKKYVTAKQQAAYDKEVEEVQSYYKNARPYMEKVRDLAPERSKVWAPALQQIYANLGMDAEADAMDDIMATNH